MKLETYRHLWGVEEPLEVCVPRFKASGYAGLEVWIPAVTEPALLRSLLRTHELKLIAAMSTDPPKSSPTVNAHLDAFERNVNLALEFNPVKLNVQAGLDAWTEREAYAFFERALEIVAKLPVQAGFETHRGRVTYNPWDTARLLEAFPDLWLTCDLSHWVVVCERLIDDQLEMIERAAARCIHLHARVGYEQGPQVSDPRAPEFLLHLTAHERWWDAIWAAQYARAEITSTLTPEFGPPPYLHTLPYTNQPVANLTEICDWMARRQLERFLKTEDSRSRGPLKQGH